MTGAVILQWIRSDYAEQVSVKSDRCCSRCVLIAACCASDGSFLQDEVPILHSQILILAT